MKTFLTIVVALITSALTTVGLLYADARFDLFQFGEAAAEAPPQQAVPNLVGLQEEDAKANLEALGFKLMVAGRQPSAAAAPGAVIAQVPAAGQLHPEGEPVSLTFALPVSNVPDVVGRNKDEATGVLEEAGYAVTTAPAEHHEEIEEGLIVAQLPKAGTPLQKGETITLTPSAGPASIEVPKLVGLRRGAAQEAAEQAGLTLAVQRVSLAETVVGKVLRQTPEPGTSVGPGAEVRVVINQ